MKTLIKVVVGVVAVLVIAVAVVGLVFDPNDYKAEIQQLARDKASLEVEIDGDIGWSLFPTLGLQLPKVNARTLEGEPLASVNRVQVAVNLWALLSGKVEMSGVLVDGLELAVKAPAEEAPAKADTGKGDGGAPALAFDLGNVDIRNARITLDDPKQGRKLVIRDLNFSGQQVASGRDFPASMAFVLELYQGDTTPASALKLDLDARLFVDLAKQLYRAQALELALEVSNQALGEQPLALKVGGGLEADLAADQAKAQALLIEVANLVAKADLQVQGLTGQLQLSGVLDIAPFDARKLLETLGQPELQTQDDDVLKRVGLSTRIDGPANTLGLKDLRLTLDDTTFKGALSYDLGSGRQQLQLQGDRLDLDRYLPPPSEAEKQPAEGAKAGAQSGERYSKEPLLPLETLKGLNLKADFGLDSLKASGLTITELALKADAAGGLVKLNEVSGKLYEGSFKHQASIDARKQPVAMSFSKTISQVQLGGLLQDLAEQDTFSGVYSMNGNFQSRGNSVYDIVHSLDGNMNLSLKDGRLNGVNLVDKLCSGLLQLKGQQPDPNAAVNYTEFSNLSGSVKVVQGVMDNQDLKAALAGVNVTGAGQVDLPAEALDYGLSLTVLQELKGPNCQIDQKLHNVSFPIRCEGGFGEKPTKLCGPDKEAMSKVLADLGAAEVKAKAEAKIEETKTEAKEKLESKVKDKLKGLFN